MEQQNYNQSAQLSNRFFQSLNANGQNCQRSICKNNVTYKVNICMQRDEKCNEYKIGNAQDNKIYDIVQILGVSITIAHFSYL